MIKQILFILFIILLPFGVFAQTLEEQKIVNITKGELKTTNPPI